VSKSFKSKIIKFYGNTFRIKKSVFKALPSKMTFLQTFTPTFSKLDILKMSIFQNLTTTFPEVLLLKINKENGY